MLINFCNENQIISALEIQDKTLTLYFHPDKPYFLTGAFKGAFTYYLQTKKLKFRHEVGNGAPKEHFQHVTDLHPSSVQIHDLPHLHWVFEKKINAHTLASILDSIAIYQNNSEYRLQNQADAFKYNSDTWLKRIVATILRTKVYGIQADINDLQVFMTKAQMKEVAKQFALYQKENNRDPAMSTDIIVNIFAKEKLEKFHIPAQEAGKLPDSKQLEKSTCTTLKALNDSINTTRENNAFTLAGTSVLLCVLGFWLSKNLFRKNTYRKNKEPFLKIF